MTPYPYFRLVYRLLYIHTRIGIWSFLRSDPIRSDKCRVVHRMPDFLSVSDRNPCLLRYPTLYISVYHSVPVAY